MSWSQTVSRSDVVATYKLLLGREPESEAVIDHHLSNPTDLEGLWRRITGSNELRRRAVDQASWQFANEYNPEAIEVDTDKDTIQSLIRRAETFWSELGRTEPYWSVLTADVFKAARIDDYHKDRFYASGREETDFLSTLFRRNGFRIDPHWSACDLGCGIGRVGDHLSGMVSQYIGVDVSASHLRAAQERFAKTDKTNGRFLLLRDFLEATDTSYDLLFSVIALQHNCPPIISWLLDTTLSRVRPNGFAFFQVPCHLYGYHFSISEYMADVAKKKTDIEMHAIPQQHVLRLLKRHGFEVVEVLPYPRIGPIGFSFLFFARRCA